MCKRGIRFKDKAKPILLPQSFSIPKPAELLKINFAILRLVLVDAR